METAYSSPTHLLQTLCDNGGLQRREEVLAPALHGQVAEDEAGRLREIDGAKAAAFTGARRAHALQLLVEVSWGEVEGGVG